MQILWIHPSQIHLEIIMGKKQIELKQKGKKHLYKIIIHNIIIPTNGLIFYF
jgi:hypothetical protein